MPVKTQTPLHCSQTRTGLPAFTFSQPGSFCEEHFVIRPSKPLFPPWKHTFNECRPTFAITLLFQTRSPNQGYSMAPGRHAVMFKMHRDARQWLCVHLDAWKELQSCSWALSISLKQEQEEVLSGASCSEIAPVPATWWLWRTNYHSIGAIPLWTAGLIECVLHYVLQAFSSPYVCLNTTEWSFPKERRSFVTDYILCAYSEKPAKHCISYKYKQWIRGIAKIIN